MSILKNKWALITGSTGGLGREIAIQFAASGVNLILFGRNEAKLEELQSDLSLFGVDTKSYTVDLSNTHELLSFLHSSLIKDLNVEILVNCAAIFSIKNLVDTSLSEIEKMFNTNVIAPILLCRHFVPHMIKNQWGRIINIASSSAYAAAPGTSLYATSKHALLGLSRALYKELKSQNVRVICVSPGTIKTSMGKKVEKLGQIYETFLDPKEVAEYILFASSLNSELISEEIRLNRLEVQ
jgi:short-subunit dehydrogenase